jgi:hypothetical protein
VDIFTSRNEILKKIKKKFFSLSIKINMSSSNIMTLVGLCAAIGLLHKYTSSCSMKESFINVPLKPVVQQEVRTNQGMNAIPQNQLYTIPGTFQASLSPRFSNLNYGAFIKYNMPSVANQAVPPVNPISYAGMNNGSCNCNNQVKEGFCSQCGVVAGCKQSFDGSGAQQMNFSGGQMAPQLANNNVAPSNYMSNNYANEMNQLSYTNTSDLLPVQNMSQGMGMAMVNQLGEVSNQPIVYDRYIYANQKSRLYAQADPIRGDLAIVPNKGEWFNVSVRPQIDLNSGALAAIGGINNETNNQLLALQNAVSGGSIDVGSGINYSVQRSNYMANAGADIITTSFP